MRQRQEEKKRKKYGNHGTRRIENGRNPERKKDSMGKRRGGRETSTGSAGRRTGESGRKGRRPEERGKVEGKGVELGFPEGCEFPSSLTGRRALFDATSRNFIITLSRHTHARTHTNARARNAAAYGLTHYHVIHLRRINEKEHAERTCNTFRKMLRSKHAVDRSRLTLLL
ncbi:hypothetical protein ALC60_14137 [Trachymyrmex zeteki]|uniref:Uncharacterized protein n=1 Tax=Mycetomoellerius zeteki TaxID=64791 RepID=A0A151WG74_9HYME|nr:hypothetical protein ALC60_14137 [Trachymyrmex zeteki]